MASIWASYYWITGVKVTSREQGWSHPPEELIDSTSMLLISAWFPLCLSAPLLSIHPHHCFALFIGWFDVFLLLIHACKCKKDFISSVRWCLCPLAPSVSVTKRARSAGRAAKPPCWWCHPSRRDRKSRVCVRAICYSRQVCFIWVPLETKDWVIWNFRHKWHGKGSASKDNSFFIYIFFRDPTAGVWTCFWLCFYAFLSHSSCAITTILSLPKMLQKEHRLPFIYCSRGCFWF